MWGIDVLLFTASAFAADTTPGNGNGDGDEVVLDLDMKLQQCTGRKGVEHRFTCDELDDLLNDYGLKLASALRCLDYNKFESPGEVMQKMDQDDREYVELSVAKLKEDGTKVKDTDVYYEANKHYTHVTVDFRKIINLDTALGIFHVDFEVSMWWVEPRIYFMRDDAECPYKEEGDDDDDGSKFDLDGYTDLEPAVADHIWTPPIELDLVINMLKKDSFNEGHGLRLHNTGIMELFGRYEAKVGCDMDFSYFPFDEQHCHFALFMKKGDNNHTTVSWSRIWPPLRVTNSSRLHVPDWTLTFYMGPAYTYYNEYEEQDCDGVRMEFHFSRVYTVHLMHTFLPSIMIALSAVLSVFVPSDLVPGRMGLCITAFLSMISLFNGARDDWPATSYMKAIDVWTAGCYFTVFFALAEYCVVLFLVKKAEWERKVVKHKQQQQQGNNTRKIHPVLDKTPKPKVFDVHGELIRYKEMAATKLEFASRICLPAFFFVFNLIFWIVMAV